MLIHIIHKSADTRSNILMPGLEYSGR